MSLTVPVAFIPLVDAAPLIVAHEMGFAGEEGLKLDLQRAPSWSTVRDMLAFGRVDAAHMLSPVPVAMALGIGGVAKPISALMVLSMNGNVIGVNRRFEERLRNAGYGFDFADADAAGKALVEVVGGDRFRIGVPFVFSMHAELLYYWLTASGLPAPQKVEIKTVPPPLMADAIAAEEIDAFCVGEPWGSKSVETGSGALLLPGRAIWSAAPEKVLAVRTDWADQEPEIAARLMRAVWKACRWLGDPGSNTAASELLARQEYLDLNAEVLDRALTGRMVINARGEARHVPGFVSFFDGAATFPWKSQAAWISAQMVTRLGLDRGQAAKAAREAFRTDLYRTHLRDAGAVLPGASEKIEGGIADQTAAASETGRLFLSENRFFDGRVFDIAAHP